MAEQLRKECQRLHIPPGNLMLDRTGNGSGVHDFIKSLWSNEVRGINYQGSASERKILAEDTKTAKEEFGRAVSELWFALKKWAEFNFIKIRPDALGEEVARELSGRRYASGKNTMVETKNEYKSRGNGSPNKADALTLLLHGAREFSKCIPSVSDDMEGTTTGHFEAGRTDRVPVFVDVTNLCETLESSDEQFYMT
jgi:hypothetical protein